MGWTTLSDGTTKLDVRPFIAQMEDELRHGADVLRRARILATLSRWQWDAMLDTRSRARARALTAEFDALEAALASPRAAPDRHPATSRPHRGGRNHRGRARAELRRRHP